MSHASLSDADVVDRVALLHYVPELVAEPVASAVKNAFRGVSEVPEKMSMALAMWPDGVWAVLLHNPDWLRPRPKQLLRAYRGAFSAGIRMRLPEEVS